MNYKTATFITRRQAAEAARALGYKTFRTVWVKDIEMWKPVYEPGDGTPADEWAKGKDFVAWCETAWVGADEGQRTRVGVAIVTITRDELELETIPPDVLVEPITPSLWARDERPQGKLTTRKVARPPWGGDGEGDQTGDAPAQADEKSKAPRPRSDAQSPTKLVWQIADEMSDKPRAEIIAACVAAGVNPATASTQFSRWKKSKGG